MKRLTLAALIASLWLVLSVLPAWAAPPLQDQPPGALDNLSQVIGALGLFAAMMGVLALGTEVVVDTLKLVVGLKRKPTALEALKELGDKLPGQLGDLGLTDEAKKQVSSLVQNLQETLKPVQQAQAITEAAQKGDLKEAFKKVDELLKLSDSQQLKTLQTSIVGQLQTGLPAIFQRLQIPDEQRKLLLEGLAKIAEPTQTDEARRAVFATLRDTAAQLTQVWMQGQEQALVKYGRETVIGLFRDQVAPELRMLGLDEQAVATAEKQLNTSLEGLSTQATLYLASTHRLLQAVENRRQDVQSPLRKVWRKLRQYRYLGYGISWFKATGFPEGTAGLLTWPEALFNWILQRQPEKGGALGEASRVEPLEPTTLAQRLWEAQGQHQDEEMSRLRILRVISACIGIYLAYVLQVNAIDILAKSASLFADLQKINTEVITTARVVQWLGPLWQLVKHTGLATLVPRAPNMQFNAGIILSGLAASAGSAFWHDQLERLQIAKKAVGQVEKVVGTLGETKE